MLVILYLLSPMYMLLLIVILSSVIVVIFTFLLLPLLYSIINLARNDDTFSDAITNRAVMESIIMGVSKTDGTNMNAQAQRMAEKAKKGKTGAVTNALNAVAEVKYPASLTNCDTFDPDTKSFFQVAMF